jgi:hypothetical protein
MRTSTTAIITLSILCTAALQFHCTSLPHLLWPQRDMESRTIGDSSWNKRTCIASRSSSFKKAVVAKIADAFSNERVFIDIMGIGDLDRIDPGDYDAVVLINTVMAWRMDRKVDAFLKNHIDQSNIIVLSTSGDGKWIPDADEMFYDAISSASETGKVGPVAVDIELRIRRSIQVR